MVLPSLIIIGGVCGSGKSTVGRALADRIGYQFRDGDDYHSEESKAKMCRGEPLTGCFECKYRIYCSNLALDVDRIPWLNKLAELWRNNTSEKFVIACSVLKQQYRSLLLDEENSKGRTKMILILEVPKEVLKQRLERRKGHYATISLLESQIATMEFPRQEETDTITVNGSDAVENVVDEILKKIA